MADTQVMRIEHIVKTPGVLGGKARITGRRIGVWMIANLYYDQDTTVEEFKEHFDLSPSEVYAALAYYHDHKEEIDLQIDEARSLESDL